MRASSRAAEKKYLATTKCLDLIMEFWLTSCREVRITFPVRDKHLH